MLQLWECPDGTLRAVFVLCSNESIAAHQRQINNSMMSRDIVLLRNYNVGIMYRNSTSCRDPPPYPRWVLRCSCCNYWDMLYMYCCGSRKEQQMMLLTNCVCVWLMAGGQMGGGRVTNQYTYEKERKSLTQSAGGRGGGRA